jgi:hypothetical protein
MNSEHVREVEVTGVAEIQSVATAGWRETYDEILDTETIENALSEWHDEPNLHDKSRAARLATSSPRQRSQSWLLFWRR